MLSMESEINPPKFIISAQNVCVCVRCPTAVRMDHTLLEHSILGQQTPHYLMSTG